MSRDSLKKIVKSDILGKILLHLNLITQERLEISQIDVEYLRFSDFPKTIPPGSYPSVKFMKQYKFVPLGMDDGVLKIAMSNPL
jgi:hypothetical protein